MILQNMSILQGIIIEQLVTTIVKEDLSTEWGKDMICHRKKSNPLRAAGNEKRKNKRNRKSTREIHDMSAHKKRKKGIFLISYVFQLSNFFEFFQLSNFFWEQQNK